MNSIKKEIIPENGLDYVVVTTSKLERLDQ